jgi:hypothetical protein
MPVMSSILLTLYLPANSLLEVPGLEFECLVLYVVKASEFSFALMTDVRYYFAL